MQRMFLAVLIVVVVLATGFCVLIIVSLVPYFSFIGKVATGVVVILLGCISVLIVSFTWSRIGIWGHRRHTIVAGDVVAYLAADGQIVHLSAMHEQAKLSTESVTMKALPMAKPTSDKETVLELFGKGISLRNIADATGLTYYQVQKMTSAGKAIDCD